MFQGAVVSSLVDAASSGNPVSFSALSALSLEELTSALFFDARQSVIMAVISGVIKKLRKKYAKKLLPFFNAIKPGIEASNIAIPIRIA